MQNEIFFSFSNPPVACMRRSVRQWTLNPTNCPRRNKVAKKITALQCVVVVKDGISAQQTPPSFIYPSSQSPVTKGLPPFVCLNIIFMLFCGLMLGSPRSQIIPPTHRAAVKNSPAPFTPLLSGILYVWWLINRRLFVIIT